VISERTGKEEMAREELVREARARLKEALKKLHHRYLLQQISTTTENDSITPMLQKMRSDNDFAEKCTNLEKLERKIVKVKEKLSVEDGSWRRKKKENGI
jgi:hypothetical protein